MGWVMQSSGVVWMMCGLISCVCGVGVVFVVLVWCVCDVCGGVGVLVWCVCDVCGVVGMLFVVLWGCLLPTAASTLIILCLNIQ